ncbi:MAG TPA: hypothetical protein VNN73_21960 [Blastocatellia bacterium]|nr:hypothetical protein [Blastocatellia bacterium]
MASILLTLIIATCLSTPIAPVVDAQAQAEREAVLQSCANVFGPPVDSEMTLHRL